MINIIQNKYFIITVCAIIQISINTGLYSQTQRDIVAGNLILFNENGAWCWYQDERVVIDDSEALMIIGSDASDEGAGGPPREGNIDCIFFDLNSGIPMRFPLMEGGIFGCDDHNTPAFLIRPDGDYLAMYAGHHSNYYSYYRIYFDGAWGIQNIFDWQTIPGGSSFPTTYSNLWYLSDEDRVYNFSRTDNRSPNIIISDNQGDTWSYGGLLTETDSTIGYVNGYFKYIGNGLNRVHFIGTEHHPRDYNTSVYHGYIEGGQSFDSFGNILDNDISDKSAPRPVEFTPVFLANTIINGDTMTRCWTIDLQLYGDSVIAAIIQARIHDNPDFPSNDPDHVFLYCRFDGSEWNSVYLSQAGKKLYEVEQDYTGLATLHPNDPNTIYISTPIDPRNDSTLAVHEIFKGTTSDQGLSWDWTPITRNSMRDNLRPLIPAWDSDNTAILWFRGTYNSYSSYDAAIVGLIERESDVENQMEYVDANSSNTTLADGSPLSVTGPGGGPGAADNQWHERTGIGNNGSVYTSAETGGENAPAIKTTVVIPIAGNYDLWINFWANPDYDWRIKGGRSADNMHLFRQMASKQVEPGDHQQTLQLTSIGDTYLYQAYAGRIQAKNNDTVDIFIDDEAIQIGTENTSIGSTARTWYDGISYASLDFSSAIRGSDNGSKPDEYRLFQNYPNPFNPSTKIQYSISKPSQVTIKIFNIIGQQMDVLVNTYQMADQYQIKFDGSNHSSGIYYCQMIINDRISQTKKMVLIR